MARQSGRMTRMLVSGIIFSDIEAKPDHAHVGAWREEDGRITVAYLGVFPKQTTHLTVHIGGAQQSAEALAKGLLVELAQKAAAE